MNSKTTTVLSDLKAYFNKIVRYIRNPDELVPQEQAEAEIRAGVSFRGSQLLILIFAILVASLGLNTDSIPVIIGAMIISPLMGPIIGMGLGIGIHDFDLLKRGLRNITMAVIGSILASAVYFLLSPQYEGSSQLLARTSPSIYDVFIALFGGAAGIVSICCKNKSSVMPGVAIATSLMPPLCTAGYGLATLQMHFFLGALYLFFTNMLFILVASWIGVIVLRYKPVVIGNQAKANKVRWIIYTIIVATIGVSVYLTVIMVQTNIFTQRASEFVEKEFVFPNTQIISHKEFIDKGQRTIDVNLIGQALPLDSLKLVMMEKMNKAGLGGTVLNIRQGFSISEGGKSTQSQGEIYDIMQRELQRRQETIDSLRALEKSKGAFSMSASIISPEIKVIFPSVKDLALSETAAVSVSGAAAPDTVYMAFVNAPAGLSEESRVKLAEYISVRLGHKKVQISVNPASFPWPKAEKPEAEEREKADRR